MNRLITTKFIYLQNRAISTVFDRDVRFHGDVQFEGEQHWYIRRNKLSLEEEIARGKFAIIFRAKLYTNKNLEESVVAKTVHGKTKIADKIR